MESQLEKKVFGIGVKIKYVGMASNLGFEDINKWIAYLLETIDKKQIQYEALKKTEEQNENPKSE